MSNCHHINIETDVLKYFIANLLDEIFHICRQETSFDNHSKLFRN